MIKKKCNVILLGLLSLLTACGYSGDSDYKQARASYMLYPVLTSQTELSGMDIRVECSGNLESCKNAVIKTPFEGRLETVLEGMKIGMPVSKNQVIATVDNETKRLKAQYAELDYKRKKKDYELKLEASQSRIIPRSELEQAEYDYQLARIDYDLSKLELQKSKLVSPFDGVITNIGDFIPGARIEKGVEIARIEDRDEYVMKTSIPLDDVASVQPGQAVEIELESPPGKILMGEVDEVGMTVDDRDRTVKIKIKTQPLGQEIMSGVFARASIIVKQLSGIITVPRRAVREIDDKTYVFVVEESYLEHPVAKLREIQTGYENKDQIEAAAGLKTGETLIVSSVQSLENHSPVKVIEQ